MPSATNRPTGLQAPFIDMHKAMLSQSELNNLLQTHHIKNVFRYVSGWVPKSLMHPQHMVQPRTWGDALKIPGSVESRMYWAALMFDAMRAEAMEQRIVMSNILDQQLEEADKQANAAQGKHPTEPMNPEGVPDDGEHFGDGMTGARDDDMWSSSNKADHIAAIWQTAYQNAFSRHILLARQAFEELGVPASAAGMALEESDTYAQEHQLDYEFRSIHDRLLGHVMDHPTDHFGLDMITFAQRFMNNATAMLHHAGIESHTVASAQASFGKKFTMALDGFLSEMKSLSNDMVSEVEKGLGKAVGRKPTPAAEPNAADFNDEVGSMGPAEDQSHQVLQWRIAMVRLMFPDAPRPAAKLHKKMDEAQGKQSKVDEREELKQEMVHYARVLEVDVQMLERAADQSFAKAFPLDAKEMKSVMDNETVAPDLEKRKTLVQREIEKHTKPQPGQQ